MADTKLEYCKCCQKKTIHAVKMYNDGTIVMECQVCRFREISKKGYNYRSYERAIARDTSTIRQPV